MIKKFSIKRVMSLIALITLSFSCLQNADRKSNFIKAYKCASIFQFVEQEENRLVTLDGDLTVVSYGNWKIYEELRPQYHFKSIIDEKTGIITDSVLYVINKYMVYVLKEGETIGYELDSTHSKVANALSFEEFKKRHEILNFSNFYDSKTDSLFAKRIHNDSLVETYIQKVKLDASYPDTVYYTYWNNLKNETGFSFSKELETRNDDKWLFRVKMVYDSITPKPSLEKGVPRRLYAYCIKDTFVKKNDIVHMIQIVSKHQGEHQN